MIKFLIQSVNNEISHDFSFHLIEAIKYKNWTLGEEAYGYVLSSEASPQAFSQHIPIGSVEFVQSFYKHHCHIENFKPINIPVELMTEKYLQRKIYDEYSILNESKIKQVFIKSADKLKDFTDFIEVKDIPLDKNLFISEMVDFLSEWRCFVYRGRLLDIRRYAGDFRITPDITQIESMINDYKHSPAAYTLDVGIIEKNGEKTVVIEAHQFYSCGLYGFRDYQHLINMFITTHKEILNSHNKS